MAATTRPTAVLLALPVLLLVLIAAPLDPPVRYGGLLLLVGAAIVVLILRPKGARAKDAGVLILASWALFFLAGAAGELLDIGWLQEATDIKKIFLR